MGRGTLPSLGILLRTVLSVAVLGYCLPVQATHGRTWTVHWVRDIGTSVRFFVSVHFRRDAHGGDGSQRVRPFSTCVTCPDDQLAQVGDVIRDTLGDTELCFGDGDCIGGGSLGPFERALFFRVLEVNEDENWLRATLIPNSTTTGIGVVHSYSSAGPFVAHVSGCCRLGKPFNLNAPTQPFHLESIVNLDLNSSPATATPPIIHCQPESLCQFSIPAISENPPSLSFRWRLATPSEMGADAIILPGPPLSDFPLAVDSSSGLVIWDTRGASASTASNSRYFATQVVIEQTDNAGQVLASTAVDFFINVASTQERRCSIEDTLYVAFDSAEVEQLALDNPAVPPTIVTSGGLPNAVDLVASQSGKEIYVLNADSVARISTAEIGFGEVAPVVSGSLSNARALVLSASEQEILVAQRNSLVQISLGTGGKSNVLVNGFSSVIGADWVDIRRAEDPERFWVLDSSGFLFELTFVDVNKAVTTDSFSTSLANARALAINQGPTVAYVLHNDSEISAVDLISGNETHIALASGLRGSAIEFNPTKESVLVAEQVLNAVYEISVEPGDPLYGSYRLNSPFLALSPNALVSTCHGTRIIKQPIRWCAVDGIAIPDVNDHVLGVMDEASQGVLSLFADIELISAATPNVAQVPILCRLSDMTDGAVTETQRQTLQNRCDMVWRGVLSPTDVSEIVCSNVPSQGEPNLGGHVALLVDAHIPSGVKGAGLQPPFLVAGVQNSISLNATAEGFVLAHEFGHTMSLGHGNGIDDDGDGRLDEERDCNGCLGSDDDGDGLIDEEDPFTEQDNLMIAGGENILTAQQVANMRAHLLLTSPNRQVDPVTPVAEALSADALGDSNTSGSDIDNFGIRVDPNLKTIDLLLSLGDAPSSATTFRFFVDADDDAGTGGAISSATQLAGIDVVGRLTMTPANVDGELEVLQDGVFQRVSDSLIEATFFSIPIVRGDLSQHVVRLRVPRGTWEPGPQVSLYVQSEAADQTVEDSARATVGFVAQEIPQCATETSSVFTGSFVAISASNLPVTSPVQVMLRSSMVGQGMTSHEGTFSSVVQIPDDAQIGSAALHVRVSGTAISPTCGLVIETLPQFVTPPTPEDNALLLASPGLLFTVNMKVRSSDPEAQPFVRSLGAPEAGQLVVGSGNPAEATFTWTPTSADLGNRLLIFEAKDQNDHTSLPRSLRVRVKNDPPIADAGGPYVAECGGPYTAVVLDGSQSSDPDGGPLELKWEGACQTQFGVLPTFVLPLGAHDIVLTVQDAGGLTASTTTTVVVRDTTPPEIVSLTIAPQCLWAPDHGYRELRVDENLRVELRDVCAGVDGVAPFVVGVTNNEAENNRGDGNTMDDVIWGTDGACLRAERSGGDTGRLYTIQVAGIDGSGNTSLSAPVNVSVFHDQRDGGCQDAPNIDEATCVFSPDLPIPETQVASLSTCVDGTTSGEITTSILGTGAGCNQRAGTSSAGTLASFVLLYLYLRRPLRRKAVPL